MPQPLFQGFEKPVCEFSGYSWEKMGFKQKLGTEKVFLLHIT